jgi:SAM-dependent methyltransferase
MTTRHPDASVLGADMADVDRSDDPQARVRYLDLATREFEKLIRAGIEGIGIQPGNRVLDVGCGAGDALLVMAELAGPTGRAVGLDISATMIAEARKRVPASDPRIEFVEHDLYDMPFANASFDAARCSRVLQHLDDPVRAIREMMRVTRPGGRIMVDDPDFGASMVDTDNPDILRRITDWWASWRFTQPGDPWRGRQLWKLCRQAGLTDLTVDGRVFWTCDLQVANQIARVLDRARDAYQAGAITLEEAEAWEEEMRRRAREGLFFAAAPGFSVYGTVPRRA